MLKITKLTEEQKGKMKEWVDIWTKKGLSTEPMDLELFKKSALKCYEFAKLKPVPIIKVDSPIVGAFASSIAVKVICELLNKKDSEVRLAVDSAVYSAVDSAVRSAVDSAVGSEVRSAVDVDSAVRSAVSSAVGSAVYSAVHSAVHSAVRSAVSSAVDSAVRSAVDSAVRSAVSSAVDSAVYSAVRSAVDSAVRLAEVKWHYWFGGSLWAGWQSYVSFFRDVCDWEPEGDILERMKAYEGAQMSAGYWWANEYFIMVSDRPKKISLNTNGRLHNEHGKAIQYRDDWGLYFLNGVKFEEELYKKVISREMPMDEILKIQDIDQRVQAMKFAKNGIREFYKQQGGKCIDSLDKFDIQARPIHYELWEIPKGEIFNQTVHFCIYDCPSSKARNEIREYAKGTPVELKTVAESMSWGMSSDENILSPENWKLLIPLEHES